MNATPVLIYGRQSHGKERSIQRQLADGRRRMETEGWTLAGEYRDEVSASRHATKARDGWPLVLGVIASGAVDGGVLWLWETSRGDRDLEAWAGLLKLCRTHRVRICVEAHGARLFDMGVARDWRDMANDGVDNEAETERLGNRVLAAKEEARRDGNLRTVLGGTPPLGYRQGAADWETDPDHARLLNAVAEAILGGQPLRPALREYVQQHGQAHDASGRPVNEKMVRAALRRPATAGLMTSREGEVTGRAAIADPPMDEITWRRMAKWFASNREAGRHTGGDAHAYALGPVLRCGKCNNQLNGGKLYYRGAETLVYVCKNPHPKLGVDNPCRGVSVNASQLDELVGRMVERWKADKPGYAATADQGGELAGARAKLEAERTEVKTWYAALRRNRLHGLIEPWEYAEEAPEYEAKIASLGKAIAAIEDEEARPAPSGEAWEDMAPDEQRALVRSTVGILTILPGRGGARPLPVADRIVLPKAAA